MGKFASGPAMILKFMKFSNLLMETASDMMKTPQFQALLKEKFDLVIIGFFMVDFNLGLGAHFNCPTVVIFSAGTATVLDGYVGNISPVASVPNIMVAKKGPMTFTDRVINFLIHTIELGFMIPLLNAQSHYYRFVELFLSIGIIVKSLLIRLLVLFLKHMCALCKYIRVYYVILNAVGCVCFDMKRN